MTKPTKSASSAGVPEPGGNLTYVLITPARNESQYIELTLRSMVRQTYRPLKWVIVSDGSTDGTDDLVKKYAAEFEWIELVRLPGHAERQFASKVYAFNAGYESIRDMRFDIIGSMDADISFDADYFAFVVSKFADNPRLGVGGTPYREGSYQYDYRFTSIEHVSGACQLFRRECFESIGGYVPRKMGGIDLVAVITARMKGWQTRSFPEKSYEHHRKMGTGNYNQFHVPFRIGFGDYVLGGHPLWEVFRAIYQMKNRPLILGGCFRLLGFWWAIVTRVEKTVPDDFVRFRRQEQMARLRAFFSKFLPS